MKKTVAITMFAILAVFAGYQIYAHCEIPCGIYDDPMRMQMIYEHIATLDKSIHEIIDLQKQENPNQNQLVRWIMNKEDHADQLQYLVMQYFMTQRVKPVAKGEEGYEKYVTQITLLHGILVEAMKAKQTVDHDAPQRLTALAKAFEASYFGEK